MGDSFGGYKAKFDAAGEDTAHRTGDVPCHVVESDVQCAGTLHYKQTFRGTLFHLKSKCSEGHVEERYGYTAEAVVDE